jgi:cytochrome d ubiquinol oxidase subunit I
LLLYGILDENNEVKYAIRLPNMLSFLSFNDFNAEVKGLNEFPEDERPPVWIHYMFDIMVTIGIYTVVVSFLYLIFDKFKGFSPHSKWLLWSIVLGGPLSLVAIEVGWIFAEVGRQPWILRGYMKVAQGATTADNVGLMFLIFIALYMVLAVVCSIVLIKMFKNKPAEVELEYRFNK